MSAFRRMGGAAARFCVAVLLCAAVLCVLILGWSWQRADKSQALADSLVDDLVDSEGSERRAALDALVALAERADPKALESVLGMLEECYNSQQQSNWLPAEEALERLAVSQRPEVFVGARAVFQRSREVRSLRALEEIERLGGSARFHHKSGRIMSVVLSERWTGGDRGLVHIERLPRLSTVYLTRNAGVSKAALEGLRAARPGLSILPRGPGSLGISGIQYPTWFQIDLVEAGSAGERGGVLPGDIIREFDGRPITNFDAVCLRLAEMKPGDRVTMRVARKRKLVDMNLVVGAQEAD